MRLTPREAAAAVTVSFLLLFRSLRVTVTFKVIPLLMNRSTEKITSDTFSSRLRELMNDRHLNQEELAQQLQMGQSTISNWLRGPEPPTRKSLKALTDFFRVTPKWLLAGEQPRDAPISSDAELIMEEPSEFGSVRQKCVQYLERFLDTCDSANRLGWAYIELTEKFPLDKWTKNRRASSVPISSEGAAAIREAETLYERGSQEREPSRKVDEPSGEKSAPSRGTSKGSKGQPPSTQGKAQG